MRALFSRLVRRGYSRREGEVALGDDATDGFVTKKVFFAII